MWLERVEVAGVEPLGSAFGVGWRATYSHVERLAAAGFVDRVYDRDGSMVAITPAGRRAAGRDRAGQAPRSTRGLLGAHSRAASWVAALLTLRGREWLSDREARERRDWLVPVIWPGSRGTHRPDLGAVIGSRRVAIEVELSHKAPRRLRAILTGYATAVARGHFDGGVLYISDRSDVLAAVQRAAVRSGVPSDRFRTRTLEDVVGEVRTLALAKRGSAAPGDLAERAG